MNQPEPSPPSSHLTFLIWSLLVCLLNQIWSVVFDFNKTFNKQSRRDRNNGGWYSNSNDGLYQIHHRKQRNADGTTPSIIGMWCHGSVYPFPIVLIPNPTNVHYYWYRLRDLHGTSGHVVCCACCCAFVFCVYILVASRMGKNTISCHINLSVLWHSYFQYISCSTRYTLTSYYTMYVHLSIAIKFNRRRHLLGTV